MKVLVAGAAGFVGRRIVEALQREPGVEVVAGVRSARPHFERMGISQRVFDGEDAASVRTAMTGVSHVVNCVMGSAAAMIATTRNLAENARAAGVRRLVHFSSIAVFGDATGLVSDSAPVSRNVDGYGQAKITCETIISGAHADGIETVILRPALIYGPGSQQWTGRIGRLLRANRLGDLGAGGDGLCNLVFIDDVVLAVIEALKRPDLDGRAINLAMANPPTWNRYLMDFAREIGAVPVARVSSRQLKLETRLVAIPLKLMEIACDKLRLRFLRISDPITPGLARLFTQEVRYGSSPIESLLGQAETEYSQGLKAAAEWFIEQEST